MVVVVGCAVIFVVFAHEKGAEAGALAALVVAGEASLRSWGAFAPTADAVAGCAVSADAEDVDSDCSAAVSDGKLPDFVTR